MYRVYGYSRAGRTCYVSAYAYAWVDALRVATGIRDLAAFAAVTRVVAP